MQERYSRQVLFRGIGAEGQARIGESHVLLIGCGALGSVVAEILVRAGVGRLTVIDRDYIDESNLQRQSLFTESDCRNGLPKAIAATNRLREINSQVEVVGQVMDVRAGTIETLLDGVSLILDGTDNFETRYLVNDVSVKYRIPWVYGACVGAYGLCSPIIPGMTPCLRCMIEQLPPAGSSPTCDTAGIIGPAVHLVASLESAEALKILTGNLKQLSRRLVCIDLWENRIAQVDLGKDGPDPACPACGLNDFEFLRGTREGHSHSLCGRNAVQVWSDSGQSIAFAPIAERLGALGEVEYNEYLLRARVPPYEIALFRDGRAIIRGTQDSDEARRVYSRYVGN
jgi:molybdopterin-synthase adenylyltransferase